MGGLGCGPCFKSANSRLCSHFHASKSWLACACPHPSSPPARRHHFFEGRPLPLFLLHAGYHAIVLGMTCGLLAMYGHPRSSDSSSTAAAAEAAAGAARRWGGGANHNHEL